MSQYLMTYIGGAQPASPEEGKVYFARYKQWLAELGDAAVSPAKPLKGTRTIHPDGTVSVGSSTAMSGYTIVELASMEEALDLARQCPFLEVGGSLEVSELIDMLL
jgi:hypothetical protein